MSTTLHIPPQPRETLRPTSIIAEGLRNPRGVHAEADGSLLLVEAGTGLPDDPFSGRISRLPADPHHPGTYLPRETLAEGFRAMNMQARMLRDEIMGLSDIAYGDGRCLVSQTDYVAGSKLLDLHFSPPEPVCHSQGNLNALCYHPGLRSWLAVKPDTNELVELRPGKEERVLAHLPNLEQGQEAVPVTLVYEPTTTAVLISLFSGELHTDPARKGMDFADKAGQVIRLWPDSGRTEVLIDGLQLPTGLALDVQGNVLVLELCASLQQPLPPAWNGDARHGGFTRFSGRLLHCDLHSGAVSVLARELDTPSNLCLVQGAVLVSEGMGLSGRPLPAPEGEVVPLDGRLRRVQLHDR
ncbi:hypothetical protein [Pseudomonas oryzicola]|uniref:SMP-30/gluconolactonase/LRE family protein n=1 Tax=Pseudomonas oryzicola TaxID=485876 RepID=A0ABS6QCC0_9PSED|nr:hypothetical protein [Pseudomonas oryzicola]MBV4491613.1 hypothetical protein [Pseudomonas oryzicola]